MRTSRAYGEETGRSFDDLLTIPANLDMQPVKRIRLQVDPPPSRDGLRSIRFDYGNDTKMAEGTRHGSKLGNIVEISLGEEEFITGVQMWHAGNRIRAVNFTFSSCNAHHNHRQTYIVVHY